MVTSCAKQAGRRYRQCAAGMAFVAALGVTGTSSGAAPTVAKRRYPQERQSPIRVQSLTPFGTSSGSGGTTSGFSRGRLVSDTMEPLKQSTARNVAIFLVLSSDHVTGATGASGTMAVKVSKNGAAFASVSPTITELESGWYNLAMTTSHTDTLGDLAFHVTATNCDPCDFKLPVEVDRTGATVSSVTGNVAGNVVGSVGSISGITFPTNFAVLSIDANGRVKVQTGIRKNTAISGFMFLMTDSTTHAPKTSASVTGTVSLDGGAFNALANSVSEVSGGFYKVNLAAGDVNADVVALRFVASGADDSDITVLTSA